MTETTTAKRKRISALEAWGDRPKIVFDNLTAEERAAVLKAAYAEAERDGLLRQHTIVFMKAQSIRAQIDALPADPRDAIQKAASERIKAVL